MNFEFNKVFINDKETGLVVDKVDFDNDDLYLTVHRKKDEFFEMMCKIGDPTLTKTDHFENQIRKIFRKEGWSLHQIDFNFGYVTFALSHPPRINFRHINEALGFERQPDPMRVIPLMQLENDDSYLRTWLYTINCRDEYFKKKTGFPEYMRVKEV